MKKESKIIETNIKGLFLVKSEIYKDDRGFFSKSLETRELVEFLVDNKINARYAPKPFVAVSSVLNNKFGTFRGFHRQGDVSNIYAQTKFVSCVNGRIVDFVIDGRTNSATYGKEMCVELSADSEYSGIIVPKGCWHAYITWQDNTVVNYYFDNFYNPKAEEILHYSKSKMVMEYINQVPNLIISEKDNRYPTENK